MNATWVVGKDYVFPKSADLEKIKSIGPIWGSWRSWRDCHCDNVICDDISDARPLLKRAFQAVCNFYLPRRYYNDLERPQGVQWYDGEFKELTVSVDEIIALHLASSQSDLVLLVGFDFGRTTASGDAIADHKLKNQLGLARQIIASSPETQWVLIDHAADLDPAFASLENLSQDSMQNVFDLLLADDQSN